MNENISAESVLYQHSGSVPMASRLSWHVRRKMFALFLERFRPSSDTRILDLGVTSDTKFVESNYFEKLYPFPNRITCVGTEDGSHLMQMYPGLQYRRVASGDPLPFDDGEFDVVFSNAVVEHAGTRSSQMAFVREACRVANAFYVTTPSRLFPVEHHTGLPLLHYLPAPVFRGLIRRTRYRFWADESNLNILTRREFAGLFPPELGATISIVRLGGMPCNMVATGRRHSTATRREGGAAGHPQ